MSGTARIVWALGCATGALAACLADRPRPGPPLLTITLSKAQAHAPDTVTGTVRADDASGIDSVWLSLDGAPPAGDNGGFLTVYESSFRVIVVRGRPAGDAIPIRLKARDVDGFVSQRDTTVPIVVP